MLDLNAFSTLPLTPQGERIAVFGGVYNNYLALEATLDDARRRGARAVYCLGDLGGFGPHPERTFPLLVDGGVELVQGNYDHSVGHALADCACGYTDPRDQRFAQISYDYTLAGTPERWRRFLRSLPPRLVRRHAGRTVAMCHGSPRQVNEFLWESTSPTRFLERLARGADVVLCTHTGLPWSRRLASGGLFVNVGAIGRPFNDGRPEVGYVLVDLDESSPPAAELVRVRYDHERLAAEMRSEGLPQEFVTTILTGYWTTCLEILPGPERARGLY